MALSLMTLSGRIYRSRTLPILILLAFLAFCSPLQAKSKKSKAKPLSKTAKQEIKLIQKLLDQHQAALERALLGAEKTTDTLVQAFCTAYADRLQTEMLALNSFLQTYGQTYTPKAGDDDWLDELIDLEGDAFTMALLDTLIGVHNRGIAYAKQANKKGYQAAFKTFAKAMIATDKQEVATLKGWLAEYEPDEEDED